MEFTGVEDTSLTTDKAVGYLSKRGRLDPIFRADPLSRKEKLILRQKALKARKAAHFNVGKNSPWTVNKSGCCESTVINFKIAGRSYIRSMWHPG